MRIVANPFAGPNGSWKSATTSAITATRRSMSSTSRKRAEDRATTKNFAKYPSCFVAPMEKQLSARAHVGTVELASAALHSAASPVASAGGTRPAKETMPLQNAAAAMVSGVFCDFLLERRSGLWTRAVGARLADPAAGAFEEPLRHDRLSSLAERAHHGARHRGAVLPRAARLPRAVALCERQHRQPNAHHAHGEPMMHGHPLREEDFAHALNIRPVPLSSM